MSLIEVEKIIVDEVYTFYHHLYLYDSQGKKLRKRNRSYLFNAMIILKNGKKFPFFKVYSSVSEASLSDFLSLLPPAKYYYSDGARIYQDCWIKPFAARKSKETNIVESFNFYCRNFNPCYCVLSRKSVTLLRTTYYVAKTLSYFNQRMIEVITRWLDQFNLQYFLKINT